MKGTLISLTVFAIFAAMFYVIFVQPDSSGNYADMSSMMQTSTK